MVTVAELQVVVGADTKGFDAGVQHVEQATKGLGASLTSGIGMGIGFGAVSTAIGLLGDAFAAAKGSIIDLNSSLEQSKIAFTTMLGGAQQADAFLQQLQTFAAQTPFEFPDLVTASKRMLAFGFESKQVVPLLTAVGDAVAAVGGGAETIDGVTTALGQMQAKGKVSAEEMGQLAERGIPAWDMLAKKLGTDIPTAMDMVSKGAVKAGTFIEAFQEGVGERFGGMMEKQAQTFAGAMSTISDSLQMALARGFKPLFDAVSAGAVALSRFVQSDAFNAWADGVATAIADVSAGLQLLGSTLLPTITDAWNTVLQVFGRDWSPDASIDPMINALGMLATFLRDVVVPAVGEVARFIVGQFTIVADWFAENMPLIQKTVEVVLAAIAALWDRYGDEIVAVLRAAWVIISTIWETGLKNLLDLLKLGMQLVTGDWQGAWDTLGDILTRTWQAYGTIIQAAWDAIFVIVDTETDGLLTKMSDAMTKLGEVVAAGWANVQTITGNGFTTGGSGIIAITASGWEAVIAETRRELGAPLQDAVAAGFDAVADYIAGLARSGSALLSAATEVGAGIVGALRDGIASALDGFWSWLKTNFTDKIPEYIRDLLGIKSPSTVMYDIGVQMMEGLKRGMESRLPSVREIVAGAVGDIGEKGDSGGKVRSYIISAASERGIDPRAALAVARHEGGEDDYMQVGKFATGWSFWPFQLHYGGKGYEYFGTTAGMGNDFTRRTDWQPGDWHAWADSIDFALDHAARHGWSAWYGRGPAGIGAWEGIPGHAEGGVFTRPHLAWIAENGPEAVVPLGRAGGHLSEQSVRIDVAVGGRLAEEIYVTGRDLAIRRGRAPTAGAA